MKVKTNRVGQAVSLALALAGGMVWAENTATIDGGVLRIALTEGCNLSEVATPAQLEALRTGQVTEVVKTGNVAFTNDVASLAGYTGNWTIEAGDFACLNPEGLGTGRITQKGTWVYLLSDAAWTNDIDYPGTGSAGLWMAGGKMNGDVTTTRANLYLKPNQPADWQGRLLCEGTKVVFQAPTGGIHNHHFYGAVRAAEFGTDAVFTIQTVSLHASDNAIGRVYAYYGCISLAGANCATNALLQLGYTENHGDGNLRGALYFDADQNCRGFVDCTGGTHVDGTSFHTSWIRNASQLTIGGTADNATDMRFAGDGRLAWNPTGAYTLNLHNSRVHPLTGGLVVSNGVMRLDTGTTFAAVQSVEIGSGATLDCASGVATALNGVKTVHVAAGGVLKVSTATALTLPTAEVRLAAGAKIELVEGASLSCKQLAVAGVPLLPADYSSVDWIVGSGAVTVATGSFNAWTAPEDGVWSDTTKWTREEVPSTAYRTYITAEGADYAVTLDVDPLTVGEVILAGEAPHRSTLAVANDVTLTDGTFVTVKDGGRWLQTDGLVVATNRTQKFTVAKGGVWRQEGGTFEYANFNSIAFTVEEGGRFEMTGGKASFHNVQQYYNTTFDLKNGDIDISGTGALYVPDSTGGPWNFAVGRIRVRDSGELFAYNNVYAGNGKTDSLVVTVQDQAYFGVQENFQIRDGVRIELGSSRQSWLGNSCRLLGRTAPSVLNVSAQGVAKGGCYNIRIAEKEYNDTGAACPTGIVNVAGFLTVDGSAINWSERPDSFDGTGVGFTPGSYAPTTAGGEKLRPSYGELNVTTGGVYVNAYGLFGIGLGASATGVVTLDGGALTNKSTRASAIGWAGGAGTLRVKDGGCARFNRSLYVGGMAMSVVGKVFATWEKVQGCWPEREGTTSEGRVTMDGGRLEVVGDLVLGAQGKGALELSAGTVTANDLVLSNNVSSVLTFKLGPGDNDCGTVTLSGKLRIAPGAQLIVDATGYEGRNGKFPLLTAADGIEGAFGASDVTLVGDSRKMRIVLAETGISARSINGFTVLIR